MRMLLFIGALLMQSPIQEPAEPESAHAGVPIVETSDDPAFLIGKGLRCPVCQGMPIAESPSTMAQDMMKRVREMLAAGKSSAEINDYFVARYGQWVLLKPATEGFALWVWVLPPLALSLGVVLALMHVRRLMRARRGATPAGPANGDGDADAAPDRAATGRADGTADPYLKAIRDEVRQ